MAARRKPQTAASPPHPARGIVAKQAARIAELEGDVKFGVETNNSLIGELANGRAAHAEVSARLAETAAERDRQRQRAADLHGLIEERDLTIFFLATRQGQLEHDAREAADKIRAFERKRNPNQISETAWSKYVAPTAAESGAMATLNEERRKSGLAAI